MTEKHWRDQYDDSANAEHKSLNAESVEKLKKRVMKKDFGEYYAIWTAIADTKDLPAFGWMMFDFIKSNEDYLQRYNCARALLAMMGTTKYEPQNLTIKHMKPEAALADVEVMLTEAIGPRRD